MICERCGKDIFENAAFCPSCGAVISSARSASPPSTSYGNYTSDPYSDPHEPQPTPMYDQGYTGIPNFSAPPQANYPSQGNYGYGPVYTPPPMYQQGPVNVTVVNNYVATPQKNSGALITEILLSLFGIYGVGWLMAGETTVGAILLVCSFVLIWPIAVIIAVVTIGFGVPLCDLPLDIIGIILNAVLLNNALNRKILPQMYTSVQVPPMQMPPQQMPPR